MAKDDPLRCTDGMEQFDRRLKWGLSALLATTVVAIVLDPPPPPPPDTSKFIFDKSALPKDMEGTFVANQVKPNTFDVTLSDRPFAHVVVRRTKTDEPSNYDQANYFAGAFVEFPDGYKIDITGQCSDNHFAKYRLYNVAVKTANPQGDSYGYQVLRGPNGPVVEGRPWLSDDIPSPPMTGWFSGLKEALFWQTADGLACRGSGASKMYFGKLEAEEAAKGVAIVATGLRVVVPNPAAEPKRNDKPRSVAQPTARLGS